MVNRLAQTDIVRLAGATGLCASIFVPLAERVSERQENRIRLKNQIDRAGELLLQAGLRSTQANEVLAPARALLEEQSTDLELGGGLAIFAAQDLFEAYRTQGDVPEMAVVGQKFHIRPLIPELENREMYILALDIKETRLIHCGPAGANEVDVPDMPRSLEEALGPEYSEKQRQQRSVGPSNRLDTMSHGAGDRGADPKDKDLRFAQAVDRALTKFLQAAEAPLIVAADAPILEIFLNHCHCKNLVQEPIEGSHRRTSAQELADLAEPIYRRKRAQSNEEILERYRQLAASGRTRSGAEAVLESATSGRVGTLLASRTALHWGRMEAGGVAAPNGAPSAGDEDLINRAAIETLANGGMVMEIDDAPELEGVGVAAMLRY